ncbi:MAG: Acetylornithine aminotransferase [Candidatus Gottesmanbacteria bacterium GW2011_GWC2_39_8]|uniref:Acetylornithine aminotransferase n=1 Tax=Candidatus Gottesmanbacteria bacterium GW2011_GWC2_39_8 TaxID=1618450 RepID=A0A0G0SCS9_9BACT|nr:MAG: Acetylornithine aminotransferase [Candidatus Gottesmanbacteria bacterium GW2011_GWC2_39_8]
MNTIKAENKYQLPTYHKFPLIIEGGKGPYVWNEKGEKYLDFYGGHAVALIGHSHPSIVSAVTKQMKKLIFYSNVVYNSQRAKAAKKLIGLTKGKFSSVFFCNSGTEANETALKLAKKYTGKDGVISFIGSFHGRTVGSLSVTGNEKYKQYVGNLVPNVSFAKFGDIQSVKKLFTPETGAIIVEVIQSIAGVKEAKPDFYKELNKLSKEKGIVLIFDEVQTGLGRTGKMFYGEHFGIYPDLITLAKGIAGGLPGGAVLVSEKVTKTVELGDHGCTFGGGPTVCAAISATIDVIVKEKLIEKAAQHGDILIKELKKFPHVISVSGKGFLLGINLDLPAKEVQTKLLNHQIIIGTSDDPHVLRIMPPLTLSKEEINFFLYVLFHILKEI